MAQLKRLAWVKIYRKMWLNSGALICSKPGYVMNVIGKTVSEDYHAKIDCPITVLWSSDDEIATAANVKRFTTLVPKCSHTNDRVKT